jgi:hypothetical protein
MYSSRDTRATGLVSNSPQCQDFFILFYKYKKVAHIAYLATDSIFLFPQRPNQARILVPRGVMPEQTPAPTQSMQRSDALSDVVNSLLNNIMDTGPSEQGPARPVAVGARQSQSTQTPWFVHPT